VDYAEYEKDLDANPGDLPERLKTQRYRAKLIRRRFYATLYNTALALAQVPHHC
jgi:hypothetical protein